MLCLSHDNFNQLCSNEGKIVPTQVLPHEAEQTLPKYVVPLLRLETWAASAQSFTL